MRIRPVAAERKLSRRLFEQLADEIKSGRLAPGARLPTEHALTRAARVSRTVVREAVAALRAEGLVITRQGVGAFVSAEPTRAPFRIEPERMQSLDDILSVGRRAPGARRPLLISSASCSNRRRESLCSAATGRMRILTTTNLVV